MKILNLTQHPATPEQVAQGVVEPREKEEIKHLLTFEELPTPSELQERANMLAMIACEELGLEEEWNPPVRGHAMIGGAPFFMAPLEYSLRSAGVCPLYAFSRREAVEEVQPDGSVKKTQVFRHLGFVEVG